MDRVRSTLVATNQTRLLWAHIAGHVVHAMNLIPSAGNDLSPHQLLFDKIPDVGHLRAFGAECICWTPSSRQHDKLQPRGDVGYMAGYVNESQNMYKVSHQSVVADVCAVWVLMPA